MLLGQDGQIKFGGRYGRRDDRRSHEQRAEDHESDFAELKKQFMTAELDIGLCDDQDADLVVIKGASSKNGELLFTFSIFFSGGAIKL